MAETPFQIPGLGQAKPNEKLPVENFAPDLIAAAASIMGEDKVTVGATNGHAQWERKEQEAKQEEATKTSTSAREGADSMELNITDTSAMGASQDQKQDVKMHDQEPKTAEGQAPDHDMKNGDDASTPDVTHALEAALDGMLSNIRASARPAQNQDGVAVIQEQQQESSDAQQEDEEAEAEWEVDSSPYESSSDSSSSDSDSDDDSEDGEGYPLLGIEETARLLMAADGDGDADGDGSGKSKGAGAALRTKNEMPEEVLPKPDVTITPEMKIERLGNIEFIVETTVVIKSQTPGEVQVLDTGSVLCREDRTVIGALAEVLGNVRSPMYTVGFRTLDEIKELELATGMPIYYSVQHANYVFTQPLKEAKGTDASNLHDEELPPEEMEFSDDEKEAEYKRAQKQKRRGAKAGRGGREQGTANGQTQPPNPATSSSLNYDEDEDGPYKPLSRPPGYGQGGPPSLPSLPPKPEAGFSPPRGGRDQGHRGAHRGGRGDFRGRIQRGGSHRGGDRRHGSRGGGGGGGYQQFGHDGAASPQTGFPSVPPPSQAPHVPPPPFGAKPAAPSGQWPAPHAPYAPPPVSYSPPAQPQVPIPHHQPPTSNFNFNYQAWNQNQGQQYQYPQAASHHQPPPPQQPAAPTYAPPYVPPQAPTWQSAGTAPPVPPAAGAYNPTFYAGYQQPPQAQQGQQYWPQQQHGAYGQGPSQ
ncbi:hypothetical protein MYCTH_2310659 [Thermothelomyces thermophilus ATCC 42464]|uniref:H/ACA ribonucleoprotein complex non-core subunit NAF1 n=1 Tax=Thermothelomyces thermophilus (strain ATCC 42464 / BCRC 31852 / DSM 1799) TaxID=573729 RepID=G2QLU0_THET4|nr:uncharacterized protein MYCTH_2310659 [Thermothelomyces thermophilus ATCC 42464]AEO60920.1 hypothetical protein MYCTH_2310659 [Thermothelomyces thermophilus ATCC 42464]